MSNLDSNDDNWTIVNRTKVKKEQKTNGQSKNHRRTQDQGRNTQDQGRRTQSKGKEGRRNYKERQAPKKTETFWEDTVPEAAPESEPVNLEELPATFVAPLQGAWAAGNIRNILANNQ